MNNEIIAHCHVSYLVVKSNMDLTDLPKPDPFKIFNSAR